MIKEKLKKIDIKAINSFANKVLFVGIVFYAFMLSFDPFFGRKIINNLFYVWLLSFNFKNLLPLIKHSRLFQVFAIFSLWLFFTCIITGDKSCWDAKLYITYLLLPVLIIATTMEARHYKLLIYTFLAGIFINALLFYGMSFGFLGEKFLFFELSFGHFDLPFMVSHMEHSLFLSLGVLLATIAAIFAGDKRTKALFAVAALIILGGLFLSTGRTGLFTLLASSLLLAIIYFRTRHLYIVGSFVVIISLFVVGFFASENLGDRVKQGYADLAKVFVEKDFESNLGVRASSYYLLPKIVELESFSPIYGTGYCRVNDEIHALHMSEFKKDGWFKSQEGHLHNSYITVFASTGFVGLALLMLLWWHMITTKIEDRYLRYSTFAFLLIVFFGGFTENMFRQIEVLKLFAVFVSMMMLIRMSKDRDLASE